MKRFSKLSKIFTPTLALLVLLFQFGCAGPAASKTVKGASTGAVVGGLGGAMTGQDAGGIATAGLAGAAIGGVIGAVQEGRERKRQETMAQQRAYQAAIARQKAQLEKEKAQLQEELDIAEGFRISDEELEEMTARAETAEERLKALQAKRQAAIDRKKLLDEMEERERDALAEIERLERELAELEAQGVVISDETPGSSTEETSPVSQQL